ncbi:Os10g0213800 [Oryza sativa Japonica Group]|uniref:Os10g0213800 protein n=1 Tax=Oryza sativa subsp. japonica TaxID=39947 RepID=Q0IYH4_ORYSJ|nr:Os10g0213800 [Oryza sativa Japonica Group]|eukprot:NP_001064327.2 Os10g0213800 [Oryza sativa Japonica Group]
MVEAPACSGCPPRVRPHLAPPKAKAETRRRREPAFFAHGLHRLPFRCRLELLPTPSRLALADLLRVGELYGGANVLRPRRRPPFRLRPLAAARSPPSSTLVWQLIPHLQIYPRDGGKQRGRDLRGALRHAGSGKELGLWGQPGRGKRAGRLGGQMGAEQRSASPCINSFGSNRIITTGHG